METQFNRFLILSLLAVVLAAVGCDRRHDVAAGAEEYDVMVQRADSLIDIAPDSALLLCRDFFASYPNADDSLYAKAKLVEGNAYFSMGDGDYLDEKAHLLTSDVINITCDLE